MLESTIVEGKVGVAESFVKHYDDYPKGTQMIIMVDFGQLTEDVCQEIDAGVMTPFKATIKKNASKLHPVQQHWFELNFEHGGEHLGGYKNLLMQMTECGLQAEYKFESVMEFADCNQEVMARYDALDKQAVDLIMSYLSQLQPNLGFDGSLLEVVESWNTGSKGLSSQTEAVKCVAGKDHQDHVYDLLPEPAVPDVHTADEIFSKNYSNKDKHKAHETGAKHVKLDAEWLD
jgi:hypothetical protein